MKVSLSKEKKLSDGSVNIIPFDDIHARYGGRMLTMPIQSEHVRSLNLSTCVGIALYEVLRQHIA